MSFGKGCMPCKRFDISQANTNIFLHFTSSVDKGVPQRRQHRVEDNGPHLGPATLRNSAMDG